ncbi:hypothetical protein P3W85_41880 [Cupriavidus basilensis]|uniref:Uncharacterized protein n=1 Tax=Cupriavidus basilensis TaxID=68895 RepID=A0ABT6B4S8_9BURK|nr:hypothetical protein [Cupriavidus basilensis]MDF3839442.1 hypothetical protein [Cupriavidus basilensis]
MSFTREGYDFRYAPLHSPQEARTLSFGRLGDWNNDYRVKCFREHTGLLGLTWASDLRDCPEGTRDDVFTSLRLARVGPQELDDLTPHWSLLRNVSNPSTWGTVQGRIAHDTADGMLSTDSVAFAENSRFAAFDGLRTVWIVDKNNRAVSYIPTSYKPCIDEFCKLQGVIDERDTLYICAKHRENRPYDCQDTRLSS